MSQLNSLHGTVFRRAILGMAVLALIGCNQRPAPKVGGPLPPPGATAPGPLQPYQQPQYPAPQPYANPLPGAQSPSYPSAGPQDAVLRGAAYLLAGGNTQVPPGSRMTVRVYDAEGADVNRPVAERTYTSNGQGLPWAYELRVPLETMRPLRKPAVAARIEGPGGEPLYLNDQAVILSEGSADDIPMVPAGSSSNSYGGFSQSSTPSQTYSSYGQPAQRAQPNYGIPDYDQGYGAPSYDVPTYPGQSYGSPSLSAPPLNAPGVL